MQLLPVSLWRELASLLCSHKRWLRRFPLPVTHGLSMGNQRSWMSREIEATPEIIEGQQWALAQQLDDLLARLRRHPPAVVLTCARGSSAHAATFGKHLIERYLGLPVAAAAPSIASVYRQQLHLRNQLVVAISQSGKSDDLIAFAKHARAAGALTVAVTNDGEAPLAAECDIVLPIGAGPERSVAATKTFVATATVLLRLIAAWSGKATLGKGLRYLPQRLAAAASLDWRPAADTLAGKANLAIIGRGPTLAIAREAALKLKEVCNLHTEAFSGAEFRHGPIALVRPNYPILMFMPTDEAATGMRKLADDLTQIGAAVLAADAGRAAPTCLSVLPPNQPEADALCLVQSFYAMTVTLAERLGIDADRPRNLRKVTRTT
jgi:glucosamine--fructose-6-phosphate aminotransferase (isomerizing)